MAKNTLPLNWCIARVEENYKAINAWLNAKWKNPTAYEKPGGYVTNNTERGVQAPYNEKPSKYTQLTTEEFVNLVVNAGTAPAGLPQYWCILFNDTDNARAVVAFVNKKGGLDFKGKVGQWYGFDGEYKCRFDSVDFNNKPVALSVTDASNMINGIVKTTNNLPAAPQVEEAPVIVNVAPPIPITYLAGHELIRLYPGSPVVGSTTCFNVNIDPTSILYNDAMFYRPIMHTTPVIGSRVVIKSQPNGLHLVINQEYNVVGVFLNMYGRIVINIHENGTNRSIDVRNIELVPTPAETIVNGFRVLRTGNLFAVRVRNTEISITINREDLLRFRALTNPNFHIRIGEGIPTVLSVAAIDAMLQLP